MINKKKIIAVIPARAGSKRLPKKNIKIINGKPLIQWTIESSKKSRYIDKIVVSTNDHEILNLSKILSTQTIKRPEKLCTDNAKSVDLLIHALNNYKDTFDIIILLQPTSPLRTVDDIDNAIEYYIEKDALSVISVSKINFKIEHINTLPKNNSMDNFLKNGISSIMTQNLEEYYKLNGAIYITDTKKLIEERTLFLNERSFAFKMHQSRSIDIDNIFDFQQAEFLLKKILNKC